MSPDIDRTRLPFDLEEGRTILARTPAVLDALLCDLPDRWVRGTEGAGTWSAFDVIGHLIHGERTDWVPRARLIVEHGDSRPFERFDRFAQLNAAAGGSMAARLDEFAAARAGSLRQLDALQLTAVDLDRRGMHPELGPVTLGQLLATWVAHDLDHIIQISRVFGRQYSDAVGPWRAYLRVVTGQPG